MTADKDLVDKEWLEKALVDLNSTLRVELLESGLVTLAQWNEAIAPKLSGIAQAIEGSHITARSYRLHESVVNLPEVTMADRIEQLSAQLAARAEPQPMAEVAYSNWNGMRIEPLPDSPRQPVGTKLYAAPPASALGGEAKPTNIAEHLFIESRGDGKWLVCVEKVYDSMHEAQTACRKWCEALTVSSKVFCIKTLVDRFLSWPLPKSFAPDCGISFDGRGLDARGYQKEWPVGTNLLTADEARQMLEYVLQGSDGYALGFQEARTRSVAASKRIADAYEAEDDSQWNEGAYNAACNCIEAISALEPKA